MTNREKKMQSAIKKELDEVKNEIKIWKDLKKYVDKHVKGKTFTISLEKEIDYMISERNTLLKNMKGELKK